MPPLAKRLVGKASPLLFGMSTPYTAFKNAASNIGGLNKSQTRQFHEYCKYLLATQRHKVNINALEDDYFRPSTLPPVPETFPYLNVLPHKHPYQIFDRHFADSLSLIPTLAKLAKDIPRPTGDSDAAAASGDASAASARAHRVSLVDIGAGGGLPGLAIAIARPDWDVTVVDTVAKKCELMRSLASLLGLTNVTVITSRAENLTFAGEPTGSASEANAANAASSTGISATAAANVKRGSGSGAPLPRLRERFDFAISRAVASYDIAAEFSMPFVRVGGWCLSMKTRLVTSEHVRDPSDTDSTWATRVAALTATSRLALLPKQLEAAVALPWKPKPHSLTALAPLLAAEADAARSVVARLGGEVDGEGEEEKSEKGVIKYVYLDPVCEVDAATGESMGVLSNDDVDRAVAAWEQEKARKEKAAAAAGGNDDDDSGADIPSNTPSSTPRAPVADPDCLLFHYLWCSRKAHPTPAEFPRLDIKPATKRGPSEAELERRAEWMAERKAAAEQRRKIREKKSHETGTAKSAWARKRMEDKAALAAGGERSEKLPPLVPKKGQKFGPNGKLPAAPGTGERSSRPGHKQGQVKRSAAAE